MIDNNANQTNTSYRIPLTNGIFLIWTDFLCLIGIAGYSAVCFTILRHKKTTFTNSFFNLALSLSVCDLTYLTVNFLFDTPSVILGPGNPLSWLTIIPGFLTLWAAWGSILHMAAICFNRLAAVMLLQSYKAYFTPTKVTFISAYCYGHAFFNAMLLYGCGCWYSFTGLSWTGVCDPARTCGASEAILIFNHTQSILILIAIVISYAAIIVRIKVMNLGGGGGGGNFAEQVSKEKTLVFQFGCVCSVYCLFEIAYTIVGFALSQKDQDLLVKNLVECMLATAALFHHSLSPFLYMTFGSDIKRLLFKKNTIQPGVPVPHALSNPINPNTSGRKVSDRERVHPTDSNGSISDMPNFVRNKSNRICPKSWTSLDGK